MNAYRVRNKHHDGRCLTFATSPEQARSLVQAHFGYMLNSAYTDWTAVREPDYDQYAPGRPRVIPTNADLPPDVPPYYVPTLT